MTTQTLDGVTVNTQTNVYFDGKCVSHGITLADGTKKSVGVILPSTRTFNTGALRNHGMCCGLVRASWMARITG